MSIGREQTGEREREREREREKECLSHCLQTAISLKAEATRTGPGVKGATSSSGCVSERVSGSVHNSMVASQSQMRDYKKRRSASLTPVIFCICTREPTSQGMQPVSLRIFNQGAHVTPQRSMNDLCIQLCTYIF